MISPFLVVIAADYFHRSNLLQLIKNTLTADIPAVENTIAALKRVNHFRTEKIVGIRQNADFHTHFNTSLCFCFPWGRVPQQDGSDGILCSIDRLYMPAVTANPEAAAQMKRQMEETGAVHEVQINPSVGTVLFLYDERQVEAGEPGTAEA